MNESVDVTRLDEPREGVPALTRDGIDVTPWNGL